MAMLNKPVARKTSLSHRWVRLKRQIQYLRRPRVQTGEMLALKKSTRQLLLPDSEPNAS